MKSLVVFVVLSVVISAVFCSRDPELQKTRRKVAVQCIRETKISFLQVRKLSRGELEKVRPKSKCFLKCFGEKLGMFSEKDGEVIIDDEYIRGYLDDIIKVKSEIPVIVEKCKAADAGANVCEYSFNAYKCFEEEIKARPDIAEDDEELFASAADALMVAGKFDLFDKEDKEEEETEATLQKIEAEDKLKLKHDELKQLVMEVAEAIMESVNKPSEVKNEAQQAEEIKEIKEVAAIIMEAAKEPEAPAVENVEAVAVVEKTEAVDVVEKTEAVTVVEPVDAVKTLDEPEATSAVEEPKAEEKPLEIKTDPIAVAAAADEVIAAALPAEEPAKEAAAAAETVNNV